MATAKGKVAAKTIRKTADSKVAAKSTRTISARYDAAGQGRRMRGWQAPSSGPNKAIEGLQTIRNRSNDAARNDWSGESGTQKWTTTLVGIGITPRFKRLKNAARKLVLSDLWSDFVAKADADGVLSYYAMQTLAVRSWFTSGEVFVRRRYRRINDGLPVPMQVQLLEADFVPLLDADNWPNLPAGNRIRSGIEFDKRNRRVAYWMYKEHPGDKPVSVTSDQLVRIPAEDVRHMYELKRPGQLRGVPGSAPILARLRSIGDFDDAVLERQKLANLFVAFITRTMPNMGDDGVDPLTGNLIDTSSGSPLVPLAPGITQELDPGQDVKFANPPEPGTTYSDYMRTNHLGTAAGFGIPYEIFSGDIKEVSDRTLRVLINEFRRFAEQRQWQIIIPMFCQPISEWFADSARLVGLCSQDEYEALRRPEHAPHGWAHIHPVQDPQGKKIEVDAGFRSRSSVIGGSGDDPDLVDSERAEDLAREKRLKLLPDPVVAPAKAAK
ncbi:portal protein [Curvibacter phage PCA1]|nr:portal protein [Curvibacter phage PCA1]